MELATIIAAHHEAGHVVAALLAGGPAPTFVTINGDGPGAGHARFRRADRAVWPTRHTIDAWAVVCAAGVIAEEALCPGAAAAPHGEGNDAVDEDAIVAAFEARHAVEARVEMAMARSASSSYDTAREQVLAAWGYAPRFDAWRARIDTRTRRLMATPRARRAVAAIAAALLVRGTLRGALAIRRVALAGRNGL